MKEYFLESENPFTCDWKYVVEGNKVHRYCRDSLTDRWRLYEGNMSLEHARKLWAVDMSFGYKRKR